MTKGILGRKVGMTEVFTTDGKLIPVTVVEVESNVVTQVKTVEKDGYNSIQLGAFDKREKVSNKPEMGHVKKANTTPKRFLKEIKGLDVTNYEVGQVISVDAFEAGEIVDVTGTSKGKGFQGTIKRHNFSRGPMSHGSHYHRAVGSRGPMRPMRVLKGKKLPGHMGNEQVTIQNLEIIAVDVENNCLLISGNIPGPKKGYVLVKTAVKNGGKNEAKELVSYVVEEIVENTNEIITEEVVDVVEETVTEETTDSVQTTTEETNEPSLETAEEETVAEEVTEETAPEENAEVNAQTTEEEK